MSFQHWMRSLLNENNKRSNSRKSRRPSRRVHRIAGPESLELRLAPAITFAVDDDPGVNVNAAHSPNVSTDINVPFNMLITPGSDIERVLVYGGTYNNGFNIGGNPPIVISQPIDVIQFVADIDPGQTGQVTVTVNPGVVPHIMIGRELSWQTDVPTTLNLPILPRTGSSTTLGIIKTGSSSLKLTSNGNTYGGPTTINAGTIIAANTSGSATGIGGTVTVNSTGTLAGTGFVGNTVIVNNNGTISPGDPTAGSSIGILTLSGTTTFNTGSILRIELNGTSAGTTYDQLVVSKAPNLSKLNLTGTVGFSPTLADKFTIISNTSADPITTKFANDLGGFVVIDGKLFQVDYAGGDGNDVVLSAVTLEKVYVDDSFAGSTVNTTPLNSPPGESPVIFGINAFTTIQEAIDAVDVGGVIYVYGGTYPGAVNVNKVIGGFQIRTNTFNATTSAETAAIINGAVTLNENALFVQVGGTNHLTFNSTINGARSLSIQGAAITTFGGAVGGTTALTSLSTDAGGSTTIGASITTTGTQSYGDAVNLSGTATLATTNSAITFTSTVNGGHALTVNTGNANSTFTGAVGGSTALSSLTVSSANTTFGGPVTTTGAFSSTTTGATGTSLGGNVTTGTSLTVSGNVLLTNNVTLNHGTTMSVSGGTVDLGSNTLTVQSGGAGTISSSIVGTGNLTKRGAGSLLLNSSTSSYSGTTTILQGDLLIGADAPSGGNGALGNSVGEVFLGDTSGSSSASLLVTGAFTVGRNIRVVAGSSGTATLGNNSATAGVFSGGVVLEKNVTLTAPSSGSAEFSGAISQTGGSRSVTKTGGGTVRLSGSSANTYDGLTTVSTGLLVLGKSTSVDAIGGNLTVASGAEAMLAASHQIPNTSSVTLDGTGRLTLDQFDEQVATLTGTGEVRFGGATGSDNTFTVGNASDFTFAGSFTGDDPGPLDRIVKVGTGTMTLSGTSTFTGRVDINAGRLLVNGEFSTTSSGKFTVASGATLGGTGSINRPVDVLAGGHLSPGTSPGIFTIDSLVMTANATLDIEINGNTVGTEYDRLVVDAGDVNLGGATLNATRLLSFVPTIGSSFMIIEKTSAGPVTGTFAQGSSIVIGGITFAINYAGGDGNDVVLTVVASNQVHVDDSFAGSTVGHAPVNAPVAGLVFGYNAFTTIQEGIDASAVGGTLFVYGGTYADAVNVNKSLSEIQLRTNPNVAAETTININGAVTLSANTTFTQIDAANHVSFGSTINGGSSLQINGTATTTFNGIVGGTTALTSLSVGGATVINTTGITTTGTQSYTGAVTLGQNATLSTTNSNVNFGSTINGAQSLTIGTGTGTTTFGAAVGDGTALTGVAVTAGSIVLNGNVTTTGAISLTGNTSLTANSTLTHVGANSLAISGGTLALGSNTLTDNATSGATTGSISSSITGTGQLIKTGDGTLTLLASNSYSGGTLLRKGTLLSANNGALGTGAVQINDSTTGSSDTTLLATVPQTVANLITVANHGTGVTTIGTSAAAGTTTFSGTVQMDRAITLQGASTETIFSNTLSGSVGLVTISGGSLVNWLANNTFVGNVDITGTGTTLQVGQSGGGDENQIPDTSRVNVGAGNFLRLAHDDEAIDALTGAGTVGVVGGGTRRLTVGANGGSGIFTGVLENNDGVLSLLKTGSGTQTLGGATANTYSGGTTLSQGTLISLQKSSAFGTGAITINDSNTGANNTSLLVTQDTAAAVVIANAITVANEGSGTTTIGSTTFNVGAFRTEFSGSIVMNKPTTMTGGNADRTSFTGVLSGTVGLVTITGGARTTWENNNTFVGDVQITGAGTLFSVGRSSGDNRNQIPDASNVDVGAGTIFQLGNDDPETINALTGSGTVRNGSNTPLALTLGAAGGSGTFSGIIQNHLSTLSIVKVGAGTQVFSGANTYSGGTSVMGGVLSVSADNNLGGSSGSLTLDNGTLLTTATFTLSGSRAVTLGVGNGTVQVADGTTLTYSGVAGGAGGLVKTGTGTLILGGANTYDGATAINAGTLRLGASNVIPDGAGKGNVSVAAGATFDLAGFSDTVNGLSGTGSVTTTADGAILTVGGNNATSTFGGVISNATGNLALVKTGTGTFTLTNANTYTGPTTVNAGVLLLNGSVTSNITVNSNGTLNGNGTVFGNVDGTGTFSPGNSPGVMTIVGNFTPSGTVQFEVNSGWTTPGTHFDQYVVTGTVNLAGSTLTFVNNNDSTAPGTGIVIKLISNDLADPTGAAASPANGATVTIGSRSFKLFYNGGDGNDVVLVEAGLAPTIVYVDDSFTQNPGQAIDDADLGTNGDQPATFGINAFKTLAEGLANVAIGGTVIVNGGNYAEAVTVGNNVLLRVGGPDVGQAVQVDTLSSNAGTTVNIVGASSLTIGAGVDATLAGGMTGSGSLQKVGAGKLTISQNNSRTGTTTLSAGTLDVLDNGALGTGTFTITGGILQSSNAARTLDLNVNLAGNFAINGLNAITLGSAGKSINLTGGTREVTVGTALVLDGVVSNGELVKQGVGTLTLTRANTFGGGLTLGAGPLRLANNAAAGTGTFTINAGSVEAVGGTRTLANSVVVGGNFSIVGSESLVLNGDTSLGSLIRTVTVDATQPATFGGTISGSGGLVKAGAGTLILTGANVYANTTTVNAGVLLVNNTTGSGTGTNAVVVNNGATLGGTGTITGTVTANAGGTVSPGTSPGILTAGTTTFSATASFVVEANGNVAGTLYDQLRVNGDVFLNDVPLDLTLGFLPGPGTELIIINNQGANPVNGQFAQGTSITVGSTTLEIDYAGGDGNDVVLKIPGSSVNLYVDDTWAGTLLGANPAFDPIGGLIFGVNAFDTVQAAIDAAPANANITIFGGTYAAVDINKVLAPFQIATNATTPGQTNVSLGAVTLSQDATFHRLGSTTLTFNSTVNGSEDLILSGAATQTTFNGAVGNLTPVGDGVGPALNIQTGPATFNSTVATRSGIVTGSGSVTFNGNVAINAVAGATSSSFGGNVTINNATFGTQSVVAGQGNATFNGTSLTLGGTGARLQVGGSTANTIQVNGNVLGASSAALLVNTNAASAVVLAGANNTYAGQTIIEAGTLTVNGVITAGGGTISPSSNARLNGSGTIHQRSVVVGSGVSNAQIQGVKLIGSGASTATTGIQINNNASAQIGGTAAGEPVTITDWGTGVQVNGANASARILGGTPRSIITNNRVGVQVIAGRALIQGTDLSFNTTGSGAAGLVAQSGAQVDAGQGFGGFDFTGLNGGGVGNGSLGGNVFDGYANHTTSAVPTVAQAIVNLNTNAPNNAKGPQGQPHDLMAQNNTFDGSSLPANIEHKVFHDFDAAIYGFVNYVTPGSLIPNIIGDPIFYSVTPTPEANNNYAQRSMIRFVRLGFDNYVYINQSSALAPLERAVVISRTGGFNQTALTPLYTGVINTLIVNNTAGFNPFATDGRYFTYDFRFSGAGVEVSGSLGDGDYTLTFNAGRIQSFLPQPPVEPGLSFPVGGIPTIQFHRLFGDGDSFHPSSQRRVDAIDQALMTPSMNSRRGMPNYREYLDFDNNGYIDLQDLIAFNRRLNRY